MPKFERPARLYFVGDDQNFVRGAPMRDLDLGGEDAHLDDAFVERLARSPAYRKSKPAGREPEKRDSPAPEPTLRVPADKE
jgi:hypothetical protein